MQPITKFLFTISTPDSELEKATILQGFAPSLCEHSYLMRGLFGMPSDIEEIATDERDVFLARRMSGDAPIHWMPLSPKGIKRMRFNAAMPFGIVIISPDDDAAQYADWKVAQASPPLIVAQQGGDLKFDEFSVETMFAHIISVCDHFEKEWTKDTVEALKTILKNPNSFPVRHLGYQVGGHNAFSPNLLALSVAGFDDMVSGRFDRQNEGDTGYIEGIVKTTNSVFDERERIGARELHKAYPIKPDLMLFAPSMYTHFREFSLNRNGKNKDLKKLDKGLQILLSQKSYAFQTTPEQMAAAGVEISDGMITPNPLMSIRQKEWFLNTDLAGLLAASELSAVIRLPNEINRTAVQVRQFAMQQRSNDARDRKRVKEFRDIQARLKDAVPKEFSDLIRRSQTGIRIVSDAPLVDRI
jgi:hypothetical protein